MEKVLNSTSFCISLAIQRKKYITLTFDRSQDTLFYYLDDAFHHTGGVPKEIWFDNMKTDVDYSRSPFSQVKVNQRFYEFSKDACFTPIACRSYRPQTKGVVEALARTMERLKVYDYEFYDTVELINIIDDLCHDLNHEVSQAIGCSPNFKWQEHKKHLHELPPNLINPYFEEPLTRIVSKESMVQFRKCKYSVDPKYIGKEVDIEISDEEGSLQIYHNNQLIRTHTITINHLNYHKEDKFNILKSDVYRHKSDEEIKMIVNSALDDYDKIEEMD